MVSKMTTVRCIKTLIHELTQQAIAADREGNRGLYKRLKVLIAYKEEQYKRGNHYEVIGL